MSIAGIRSNRGDGYQTLVAIDWALSVLSNPDYSWIEVDSVAYTVDDVVVGKSNGEQICCQCKKNQIDFKTWTVTDLADELEKASGLLAKKPNTEIRFYSRSSFEALAKLREHSTTQADDAAYRASLGKDHQKTDADLRLVIAKTSSLSTYEFLRRTIFEISPELDRMQVLQRERLGYMASNPSAAYNALWKRLDQLGARIEGPNNVSATAQHRLTKDDLKSILHQAGAMLVPEMSLAEVQASFASTSAIGRSWRRHIAGEHIVSPVVNELLTAIDSRKRAILLTGLPGAGKTCVMLALQEVLEQRAKTCSYLMPLFIQSREFADLASAHDRQAQGLPEHWVEKVARMADDARVVVVIDSLDVLSIAREHNVLTYFLAQMDRLLLIPNVTVVTACRDFDRHYDRRIAERQWDAELKCAPLDWNTEITPLLFKLEVDTTAIDTATRELIRNPRELALFVELAQREGSFSVVTSHALAQRYIETIVRADNTLGDAAIQAIEAIAAEMLKSRSLTLPRQRFPASTDIQRALLSHNVLHETQDRKLTFGHQTLLDVLVISGALRSGVTLNEFINNLPLVPFVRPSIRSFIAQLAIGDRREFRKQLRAVLVGDNAFHIRRLVAESFAEQAPKDDDWPLIRDLRDGHREVFQVIYTQAVLVEWNHFWLKHLVPVLKEVRDAEGLTMHAHRVSQWVNKDTAEVVAFWTELLSLDWIDVEQISRGIGFKIAEALAEHSAQLAPLINRLLDMPRQEHSFLGRAVARCVAAGSIDDVLLWRYVAGDVHDSDALAFHFDKKLHCGYREFGDDQEDFFRQRMQQSTVLLDLALGAVEHWGSLKLAQYGETRISTWNSFLGETSYNDAHSQNEHRHVSSERMLFDALQASILNHALTHSDWWKTNRERLCFNHEGALRYFAILACTASPEANIDVIKRMLCDKDFLESALSYELGAMMQVVFIFLDVSGQDAVMAEILTVMDEEVTDERQHFWALQARSTFISTIPRHLRSPVAQKLLDAYENKAGTLIRQPDIGMRGGMVQAPFSFEVFLSASDASVLRLLSHYVGHTRHARHFDDFLTGGEREVGSQLREAASRHPARFLQLLPGHWSEISRNFRDDILDGVASYLAYKYGNWQPNGVWAPISEPESHVLTQHVLDELERHPAHWQHNRAASHALQSCAHVVQDTQDATRLVFLALGFANLREDNPIKGDAVDLVSMGINMVRGHVAEALIILCSQLQKHSIRFPELLLPALRRFAIDDHPAIRAVILRRLPYFQNQNPEVGWELIHLTTRDAATGIWKVAEPCLYYAYHQHFEKIAPLLSRLRNEGSGKDFKTWGRISALAALSNRINLVDWLDELKALDVSEAWQGAASVWTYPENMKQHRTQCLAGIEAGLSASNPHAVEVARRAEQLFRADTDAISVPEEVIRRCFAVFETDTENKQRDLFGFDKWLNARAHVNPEQALAATEMYLDYVARNKPHLYNHENNLTQLLTRLFSEAEEREESDHGAMLKRVVAVQDKLLGLGVNGMDDWLKAAERP
jgi:GTPase SAR1 family protein